MPEPQQYTTRDFLDEYSGSGSPQLVWHGFLKEVAEGKTGKTFVVSSGHQCGGWVQIPENAVQKVLGYGRHASPPGSPEQGEYEYVGLVLGDRCTKDMLAQLLHMALKFGIKNDPDAAAPSPARTSPPHPMRR